MGLTCLRAKGGGSRGGADGGVVSVRECRGNPEWKEGGGPGLGRISLARMRDSEEPKPTGHRLDIDRRGGAGGGELRVFRWFGAPVVKGQKRVLMVAEDRQ